MEGNKAVVRQPAPIFKGQAWWNKKFQEISLEQFKGKYVILFFYPLDFTFVCPTEICQFSDKYDEFQQIGVQLVACSIDSKFSHREWTMKERKKGGIGETSLPMLSDLTHEISRDYGCLIQDPADGDQGVAFRATYIIDKKGILRHIAVNDLPVGRSPDEYMRLVQAFQYSDEYGEVCPASWKPGKKTMKADVDANKEYWEKEHAKQ